MLCLVTPAVAAAPVGPVTSIRVAQTGIGPGAEACAEFVVTPAKVRAFLDRAVIITAGQRHDFFLYGPCSAHGTMKTRYGTWHWELRNMGTGSITATSGEVFLLGDPSQESSLGVE